MRAIWSIVVALAGCAEVFHIENTTGPSTPDAPAGQATLTVVVTGGGTITSTPAGIDCGTTCSYDFDLGTTVTLVETAGDATFTGWSGACTGTDACAVTMSGPIEVDAMFSCPTGSTMFAFTGTPQTFSRPACVTTINVDVSGAAGGTAFYISAVGTGALGGRVQATLAIAPTDVITVFVGGSGGNAVSGVPGGGGFNGGATGSVNASQAGGGGGGASDIRLGAMALTDRVFVAAGGGGVAACGGNPYVGGVGGGLTGGTSTVCGVAVVAAGGNQTAGGVGGTYTGFASGQPGTLGTGGAAGATTGGGGGGAGYYGGGGGAWTGGAGGSSFATPTATNVTHTQGSQPGNGSVTISY